MTDHTGWYEFVTPGSAATTHVAYVHEDGSVYLPEGRDVVDETDFRMAAGTDRFWRLVRVAELESVRAERDALQASLRRMINVYEGWAKTLTVSHRAMTVANQVADDLRALLDATPSVHQPAPDGTAGGDGS